MDNVKKAFQYSHPQMGFHLPNSPKAGIMKLFPPRESLIIDISAGDGNIKKLFYGVGVVVDFHVL